MQGSRTHDPGHIFQHQNHDPGSESRNGSGNFPLIPVLAAAAVTGLIAAGTVLCATIPAGAVGFLLRRVASISYGQVMYSGIGMLLTGVLLLVADMVPAGNKIPKDITWKQGILIGIIQGISIISGISRMGLVLVCGILLGFNKRLAIRFSYLLSIPAILGAMITQVSNVPVILTTPRYAGTCLAGAVSAALVGFLSIRAISKFVRQRGLRLFAIWSFVLGIAIIAVSYVL